MTLQSRMVVALIRRYQKNLSPLLGTRCRFSPTCSEYCVLAVQKHGCSRGLYLSARRLARCHPFRESGVDDVPETFRFRRISTAP